MTAPRVRRGSTLAEMSVALVITGIAAALGAGVLAVAERRARRDAGADRAAQTARDVAHVLRAEFAAARRESLLFLGDTAVELDAHVGASVVCVASPGVAVLPAARTTLAVPFTHWRQPPEDGDLLAVWDTAALTWRAVSVIGVSFRADGAGCPTGAFRTIADSIRREPVARLRLAPALPASVGPGAPARVLRRGRWSLYRGADRSWWLGYRRCPAGSCGAPQPVAGPLAPPADSGLRFAAEPGGAIAVVVRPAGPGGATAPSRRYVMAVRGAPRGP